MNDSQQAFIVTVLFIIFMFWQFTLSDLLTSEDGTLIPVWLDWVIVLGIPTLAMTVWGTYAFM